MFSAITTARCGTEKKARADCRRITTIPWRREGVRRGLALAERAAEVPEDAEASPVAPEVCIEVVSGSNMRKEMNEKRPLYFEAGAEEVWIVSTEGAAS